jgi:deoxyribonuclease-4
MKLGFHVSIAGGFKKAVAEAEARHCATIQIFSRNPRGWKFGPLDEADIRAFREGIKRTGIAPVFVHMPYLPNLATSDPRLYDRSAQSLAEDLTRSERVGAGYLIMHIGSAPDRTRGLTQMTDGIRETLARVKNQVILLLENTAGAGNALGSRFEEIRTLLDQVGMPSRTGVVLDIAHAFEAGYDFRTRAAAIASLAEFDRTIGFERLHLVHFNDSKSALGSRHDRHWHIGKGEIGAGMGHVLNHPALKNIPFIMETPRTDRKEDLMNLRAAQQLIRKTR